MTATAPQIVELDSRNRVSLTAVPDRRARYLMTVDEDGTITLAPAIVLTEFEYKYRLSEARAIVEEGRAHPERRRLERPGPSEETE